MRISWDEYFIEISNLIAKRGSCKKRQVGAVIVKDNKILGCGYNGSPKGMAHCIDEGCLIEGDNHCVRCLHAEMNAILQCKENADGATLYSTCLSCPICFKLLIQIGIKRIVYLNDRRKDDIKYWLDNSNIKIEQWQK